MAKKNSNVDGDDGVIGRALLRSVLVIAAVASIAISIWGVRRYLRPVEEASVVEVDAPKVRRSQTASVPALPFMDVTESAGIDFVHNNGAAGEKLLPETMGSGVAWLDYDNDGDQDLLFINSKPWPWDESSHSARSSTCHLYMNDGKGRFEDVSQTAKIDISLYGMGVAVGDYDNDGWTDVFVSAVGANRLLKNESGVFRDVTESAGVAGAIDSWSTSCGFVDYDNDGLLDLMVCNYIQWSKESDLSQSFSIDGVHRAYGPPRAFGGTFSYLYHNGGEGKFTDVSQAAGLQVTNRSTGVPLAKGMGLAPADVNEDGYIDFIIANDTVQNFLLINQKNGTFREEGEMCGLAYDRDGNARGAMGIDAAVFRDDGTLAITIGNFANEPTALYLASDPGLPQFNDLAMATGIGPQTRLGLTFGIFFADLDLDGRLDVVGANGHLEQEINTVQSTQFYAQPPQIFWNAGREGGNQMVPATDRQTGAAFHQPMVGRGAAYADFDSDGDLDVVITANGGQPRLLRNDQALGNHWLRLELVGKASNRSAIGAVVNVRAGGKSWQRMVMPTRSYLSQCELPLTFGFGQIDKIESATVTWPGGKEQRVAIEGVDLKVKVMEE